MNAIAAARAELKTMYDESFAIVAKNGGVIDDKLSNEDRARLTELKTTMLPKEAALDQLIADAGDTERITKGRDQYGRPVETHRQPSGDPRGAFAASVGAGVVDSEQYREARRLGLLSQTGHVLRVPLPEAMSLAAEAKRSGLPRELRALLTSNDASGGAFVVPDRLAGYTTLARGELAFLDVLPTQTTTSDLVEYIMQDLRTNAAVPVAEATASSGTTGTKPESALSFSVASRPVESIPTMLPITTRILNDAPQLMGVIDDELMYMLRVTLEAQCVNGNGTSPNLLGINNVPGIQTLAAAGSANAADAIFAAAMAVRFTGGVPATVAVVGPATFSALRLLRETGASGGGYLMGPPNMPGPMTIFGLDIVTAQALPAATAFVLNATATTIALIERQGPTIETGWVNDDFRRNIVQIRAELRATLVTRRPAGICKVTGMP